MLTSSFSTICTDREYTVHINASHALWFARILFQNIYPCTDFFLHHLRVGFSICKMFFPSYFFSTFEKLQQNSHVYFKFITSFVGSLFFTHKITLKLKWFEERVKNSSGILYLSLIQTNCLNKCKTHHCQYCAGFKNYDSKFYFCLKWNSSKIKQEKVWVHFKPITIFAQ